MGGGECVCFFLKFLDGDGLNFWVYFFCLFKEVEDLQEIIGLLAYQCCILKNNFLVFLLQRWQWGNSFYFCLFSLRNGPLTASTT